MTRVLIEGIDDIALLFVLYFLLGLTGCGLMLWLGRRRWAAYSGLVASAAGLMTTCAFFPVGEEWLALSFFPTAFFGYSGAIHAAAPRGRRTRWLPYPAMAAALL